MVLPELRALNPLIRGRSPELPACTARSQDREAATAGSCVAGGGGVLSGPGVQAYISQAWSSGLQGGVGVRASGPPWNTFWGRVAVV